MSISARTAGPSPETTLFLRKDSPVFSRRFLLPALLAGWLGASGGWQAVRADPPQTKDRSRPNQGTPGKDQDADPKGLAEDARRLGIKDIPRVHLYRANSSADQKKYDKAIAGFTRVIEKIGLENSCRS
jgi:hypothetical protein